MIRLGNIDYTNCYPIHADLIDGQRPPWLHITDGPPAALNALLAAGDLDVAPCSSIEAARHASDYVVLSDLCIGSDGPVESITLVSRVPLDQLGGARVALPTASATSRCLARILLETRLGVTPRWEDFEQGHRDPLDRASSSDDVDGVDADPVQAALFIGDVALRRNRRPGELVADLGAEWREWTGLPFVFALWQARAELTGSPELAWLHDALVAARDRLSVESHALASAAASRYDVDPDRLGAYWKTVKYRLDDRMLDGLRLFYRMAADLGEVPPDSDVTLVVPHAT